MKKIQNFFLMKAVFLFCYIPLCFPSLHLACVSFVKISSMKKWLSCDQPVICVLFLLLLEEILKSGTLALAIKTQYSQDRRLIKGPVPALLVVLNVLVLNVLVKTLRTSVLRSGILAYYIISDTINVDRRGGRGLCVCVSGMAGGDGCLIHVDGAGYGNQSHTCSGGKV